MQVDNAEPSVTDSESPSMQRENAAAPDGSPSLLSESVDSETTWTQTPQTNHDAPSSDTFFFLLICVWEIKSR